MICSGNRMVLALLLAAGIANGCATTLEGEAGHASVAAKEASMETKRTVDELILLPAPRMITPRPAGWPLDFEHRPSTAEGGAHGLDRLAALAERILTAHDGLAPPKPVGDAPVRLRIQPEAMPHEQGYILEIEPDGIRITAHDEPGVFYGLMTLKQVVRQCAASGQLPGLVIEDWPDFPNRGIMLDVARDKVPEMGTLYTLVDTLAEWKINQLQLYTEHTFAYRDHPIVWQDASPMTPVQIRALDAYCKDRYIELVPNQNSFGHMGRWLKHDAYAHLGEMPEGGSDLCPVDPGSIALLTNMYDDLPPNFSSSQFNVGCDETWSLGRGRSKEACEREGTGRVYLGFLQQIYQVLQRHGRTMQFWGDIIMLHPELIAELPGNVIAMEWGYEAEHPFAEHGKVFAESKVPFYVVPGTSTWNSLAGRTHNALGNLLNAAENGLANGAIGYLVTDWGDGGHWQFLPASYLGFAYGAGVSWACAENKDLDVQRALNVHAFKDGAGVMGKLAHDLGNAYRICGVTPGNSTIYYVLLSRRIESELDDVLTADGLRETISYIDQVMEALPQADMDRPDAELIAREYEMTAALMRFACWLGIARLEAGGVGTSQLPALVRHELAAELATLLPEYRQVWLARNRSGGLKDSAGRFERLLAILEAAE